MEAGESETGISGEDAVASSEMEAMRWQQVNQKQEFPAKMP
jgi:hypothetical protein